MISHNTDIKSKLVASQQEISNLKHDLAKRDSDFSIERETFLATQRLREQESFDAIALRSSAFEANDKASKLRDHIDELGRRLVDQKASYDASLEDSRRRAADAVKKKAEEMQQIVVDNVQLKRLLEDLQYSVTHAESSYHHNEQRLLGEKEKLRSELLEVTKENAALR